MRFSSSSATVLLVVAMLSTVPVHASSPEKKPPQTVDEREFKRPEVRAWDIIAAPFYLPEFVIRSVLVPVGLTAGWLFKHDVPKRVEDLLSDDTGRIWVIPSVDYSSTDGWALGGAFLFKDMFYEQKTLQLSAAVHTNLDASASASFKKPARYIEPLFYKVGAKYKKNTDADFYGVGINSSPSDKSIYTLEKAGFTLTVGWRFRRLQQLSLAGKFGLLYSGTGTGAQTDSTLLVEDTFEDAELVGFDEKISWIHYGAELKYDSRLPNAHPYRGWLYALGVDRFEDPDNEFSHLLLWAAVGTVIDLYNQENVLALDFKFVSVEDPGGQTPFYRLPALDDKNGLRGFGGGRFRDRRTIVGNIEYRFPLWKSIRTDPILGLGIFFVDLGKPFDGASTLVSDGILYSVGTAFRLTSLKRYFTSARLGYGGEGVATNLSIGSVF